MASQLIDKTPSIVPGPSSPLPLPECLRVSSVSSGSLPTAQLPPHALLLSLFAHLPLKIIPRTGGTVCPGSWVPDGQGPQTQQGSCLCNNPGMLFPSELRWLPPRHLFFPAFIRVGKVVGEQQRACILSHQLCDFEQTFYPLQFSLLTSPTSSAAPEHQPLNRRGLGCLGEE